MKVQARDFESILVVSCSCVLKRRMCHSFLKQPNHQSQMILACLPRNRARQRLVKNRWCIRCVVSLVN